MRYSTQNYYKTLEVDSEASLEVIEAAYRRLARRRHPDLNGSQEAKRLMQELNEAYAILRDPQQRSAYDLHVRNQGSAQVQRTTASPSSPADTQSHAGHRPPPKPSAGASRPNPYSDPNAVMAATCQKCGRSDASLRFAQFPFVIS